MGVRLAGLRAAVRLELTVELALTSAWEATKTRSRRTFAFRKIGVELCFFPPALAPEVQRDFRHKQSSPGEEMTPEENSAWTHQLMRFFKKQENTADKKKAGAKKALTQPRLATLDWLRTTEHSMRQSTSMTFATFSNFSLLEQAEVQHGRVLFPAASAATSEDWCPSIMVVSSDRCSTQLSAINFLLFKLRISLAFLCDPSHAAWRSVLDGLTQSGYLAVITVAQVLYNVAYGPFQRSSFFRYLSEATSDAAQNMQADDPLLCFFWQRIADDLGWQGELRGVRGREQFLSMLEAMEPGSLKGPKASTGRFYSFCGAHRFWDATHHVKLFLIAYTGLRMGWVKDFKDIFDPPEADMAETDLVKADGDGSGLPKPCLQDGVGEPALRPSGSSAAQASGRQQGATTSSSSSTAIPGAAPCSGASSSSSCALPGPSAPSGASPPPAPSAARAKAEAKSTTAAERGRSANTLHAVGRLLANSSLTRQIRMVGLATNELSLKYGAAYKEMRDGDTTMRWYAEWAHWSWVCVGCRFQCNAEGVSVGEVISGPGPDRTSLCGASAHGANIKRSSPPSGDHRGQMPLCYVGHRLCEMCPPISTRRSWVEELCAVFHTAEDLAGLRRCGIIVDMSDKRLARLAMDDTLVLVQDKLYSEYFCLCFNLVRSRATAMIRHILGLPEMFAGLLHNDSTKQQESFSKLKSFYEGYMAASVRKEEVVKHMVARSLFGTTAIRLACLFAQSGRWQHVTQQLKVWLHTVFKSIGQTVVLENANKELRDREQRGSTGKSFNKFDKWACPVDLKLLEKFGRREVSPLSCAGSPPLGFDSARPFCPVSDKDGTNDSLDFRSVLGKQDWTTFNTVSILDVFSEMILLRHGHERDAWHDLGGAWHSSFIPEGEVIVQKGDKPQGNFVLKVLKGVALTWPVRRIGSNCWELKATAELNLQVILSLDDWYVLPSQLHSPLHKFLTGERDLSAFRFVVAGKGVPILEWQSERCFAKVPEHALEKMLGEVGVDENDRICVGAGRNSERLALLLMLRITPGLAEHAAAERLRKKQLSESADKACFLDDLTPDAITDCVLLGDQKDTKVVVDERKAMITKRAKDKQGIIDLMAAFYPKACDIGKRAQAKAQTNKKAAQAATERHRFFTALDGNASEELARSMPASVKLVTDEPNGRWLISHPSFKVKSISWSMRGASKGARLVLTTAWSWHSQTTGEDPPDHIRDLEISGLAP